MAQKVNYTFPRFLYPKLINSPIMIEEIIGKSIDECLNSFDPTYEDYVGIYHQIMAMELEYV